VGKVISSLIFLALLAMSSAASAIPVKMLKHNQRSSGGTLSTLAWKDCGSVGPFIAPCLNPNNQWVIDNGVTGSTVTWDWDPTSRVLTGTGLYWAHSYINSNTAGSSVLSDRVVDLRINVQGHDTTATDYRCIEGTFLKSVGANGCGTYNLGVDFVDSSSVEYNIGGDYRCIHRTLAGDDVSTGSPRGARDSPSVGPGCDPTRGAFLLYTLVQDNLSAGGTLVISNGICLGTAQVEAGCANVNYMTFTLESLAVNDGPINGLTPVDIRVMDNDVTGTGEAAFTDPVTVEVTTPPAHGTAVPNGSPGPQAGITVTYTFTDNACVATDTFAYTVTDANGVIGTANVTMNLFSDDFLTIAHDPANAPLDIAVGANDIRRHVNCQALTDPITIAIVDGTGDHGGTAVVVDPLPGSHDTRTITYTPAWTPGTPTYTETFTYQITDANGVTDTATLSVTVQNKVPGCGSVEMGSCVGLGDQTFEIETKAEPAFIAGAGFKNVIQAAFGADNLGDAPNMIFCIGPDGSTQIPADQCTGVATASGKGAFRFDPAINQFTYSIQDPTFLQGEDSFRYRIVDADGEEFTGTVNVEIPEALAGKSSPTDTSLEDVFDDVGFSSHILVKNGRGLPQVLDDSPEDTTDIGYDPANCLPDAVERAFSYCPLTIVTTQNTPSSEWALPVVLGNGEISQHTSEVVTNGLHGDCEVPDTVDPEKGFVITYTPDEGFIGTDQCRVRVSDADAEGNGPESDEGWVYVRVEEATTGGGGGGLSGGGGSLDPLSLSLLAAASGWLRRRRRRPVAGIPLVNNASAGIG
jgi:hypothetical protein